MDSSVTCHTFLSHVTHFCHMSHISVTCHIFLSHVKQFCHMSHISVTCHTVLSHATQFCHMSHISVTCHIVLSHVTQFYHMPHSSVTCHIFLFCFRLLLGRLIQLREGRVQQTWQLRLLTWTTTIPCSHQLTLDLSQ